jgi:hypothetical protein
MVYPIIGRRKRGKTTLARYMVSKSARRLVFDPRKTIPVGPDAVRVYLPSALHDVAMPLLEAGEIAEVVYTPDSDDLGGPFDAFACELKRWTTEHPAEPLGVLIDELGWIESARRDPPALRRALRNCEPELVDVFITCHRPSDIPTNTRSIADRWVLFHCAQEHDLDVIRERCSDATAQLASTLTGRAFLVYDDADHTVTLFPETQPSVWHVPLLSATERAQYAEPLSSVASRPVELRRVSLDRRLPLDE